GRCARVRRAPRPPAPRPPPRRPSGRSSAPRGRGPRRCRNRARAPRPYPATPRRGRQTSSRGPSLPGEGHLAYPAAGRYNDCMAPPGERHDKVKRELLVRLLDDAVPALPHGAKRFTYAEGYAGSGRSSVAALRVFAEFADRLRGRRLAVVLTGADPDALPARLAWAGGGPGRPAQVQVSVVAGGCDDELVPALRAAGAFGAPILAYLDAVGATPPGYDTIAAIAAGRRTDVLLALDPTALPAPA